MKGDYLFMPVPKDLAFTRKYVTSYQLHSLVKRLREGTTTIEDDKLIEVLRAEYKRIY